MSKLKSVVDAPGNFLNDVCGGAKSILSTVGNTFKTGFKEVENFFKNPFGKRKKRESGCGIGAVVPEINVDAPQINLDTLKDFAKSKSRSRAILS